MTAAGYRTQVPEVGLALAARAAIWMRDVERLARVVERTLALPSSGAVSQAYTARDRGALAALQGNRDEGLRDFRFVRTEMRRMEQWFDYAAMAVDAAVLLPEEPDIRDWAAEARTILERLRARPFLHRLDAALADATAPTGARMTEAGVSARTTT